MLLLLLACSPPDKPDADDPVAPACTVEGAEYAAGSTTARRTWSLAYDTDEELITAVYRQDGATWAHRFARVDGCLTGHGIEATFADGATQSSTRVYVCDEYTNPTELHGTDTADTGAVATWSGHWAYTYDADRLLTLTYAEEGDYGEAGYVAEYTWVDDRLYQVDQDDYHTASTTRYGYDDAGQVELLQWWGVGQELRVEYGYDDAGRVEVESTGPAADGPTDTTIAYGYEGDEPYYTDAAWSTGVASHQDLDCG